MTREERIQRAETAGVEAILRDDICARSAMAGLKAAFPEIPLKADASCSAGVTPELHRAALMTMKSCQIDVTGE